MKLQLYGMKEGNMKYRAIIFDLDGVICFTDKYHYQAWKKLADRLGIYFDEEINNRLRGVSRMESLEIILERSDKAYSQEEKDAFAEEKNETYRKLLTQMSTADLAGGKGDARCAPRKGLEACDRILQQEYENDLRTDRSGRFL